MAAVTLKRLVGTAGAGEDQSHGSDRVYDVLKALVEGQNELNASLTQLIADHDSSTAPTTAAAVANKVTVE
jgi:hypothetical protein